MLLYSIPYKDLIQTAVNWNVFGDFKQVLDQFLRLYKGCLNPVVYTNAAGNTAKALVISPKIIMVLVKFSSEGGTGRQGHAGHSFTQKEKTQENKGNMEKILDKSWIGIFFMITKCDKK